MPQAKKTTPPKVAEFKPPTTSEDLPVKEESKPPVSFDWNDLPDLLPQEYTRATISPRVDIEAETPKVVQERLWQSYDKYVKAEEEAIEHKKDLASKPVKDALSYAATSILECGTNERAEEFVRIARRYIKFLGNKTFRGAVDVKNPTRVVFRVVPLQTRVVAKSVTPDVEPAAKAETGF